MKLKKAKRFNTVESYAACICTHASCSCYCGCDCGCPGGSFDSAIDAMTVSYSNNESAVNFVSGTPSEANRL